MTAARARRRPHAAAAASAHPLVASAAALLERLLRFDAPADRLVAAYFREHRHGSRDRALLADTAYRVLRERLLFEHLAQDGDGPLALRLALLGWAGDPTQLRLHLDASQRRWLDAAMSIDRSTLPEPLRHNLPPWLADALRLQVGDAFWPLVQALNAPAPLDLRVNTLRVRRDEVQAELARVGIEALPTPFSPWGLRVSGKPSLAQLDVVARGDVDVQDEGSQLIALLVDAKRGQTVVDFCAGGGGKTLALGVAMRNRGRLYALDTSATRLDALRERLPRAGLDCVYTMQLAHERDARLQRLAGKADRVLVDAPCSGTGTLRRHPDLRWRVAAEQIRGYAAQQLSILQAAARLVKPGGMLVYATCSLLTEENEAVALSFEAVQPGFRREPAEGAPAAPVDEPRQFPFDASLIRTWPHLHGTDGFFAVRWLRH